MLLITYASFVTKILVIVESIQEYGLTQESNLPLCFENSRALSYVFTTLNSIPTITYALTLHIQEDNQVKFAGTQTLD